MEGAEGIYVCKGDIFICQSNNSCLKSLRKGRRGNNVFSWIFKVGRLTSFKSGAVARGPQTMMTCLYGTKEGAHKSFMW